jgi:uncharacterized protein
LKTGTPPFWKTKSLEQMTPEEWESLCDGCGNCCLEKFEDWESGEIQVFPVACEYLDVTTGRCLIYEERTLVNSDCLSLTAETVKEIHWLPETCAYRLLAEGKDLPWWHPLVSGRSKTVHEAGISVCDRVLPGSFVHPEDLRKSGRKNMRRSAARRVKRRHKRSAEGDHDPVP